MIIGIGFGFYSTYLGYNHTAAGEMDFRSFISHDPKTVTEMRDLYIGMMEPVYYAGKTEALQRLGISLFLAGLGVFVVARRQRWNKAFDDRI